VKVARKQPMVLPSRGTGPQTAIDLGRYAGK
jgi:hypothetical protein